MSKTGLQTINRKNNLKQWSALVEDCRNSGMSVSRWCENNNIPKSTYYTWQRKVFNTLSAENTFIEIELTSDPAEISVHSIAKLSVSGVTAEIYAGADEKSLTALLRAMKIC